MRRLRGALPPCTVEQRRGAQQIRQPIFNHSQARAVGWGHETSNQAPSSSSWKSKWIPSYRIPELESIAAAYPKCALLYTCVEQRRGFVVQINVVDGVVTDTRPEGCTASEVVEKAIAIPSIRRMWEKSG